MQISFQISLNKPVGAPPTDLDSSIFYLSELFSEIITSSEMRVNYENGKQLEIFSLVSFLTRNLQISSLKMKQLRFETL